MTSPANQTCCQSNRSHFSGVKRTNPTNEGNEYKPVRVEKMSAAARRPLTWSLQTHSPVPGYMCTFPGSAACGHRRCDNEGLRRQCMWLDEEGSEDNTNQGQWLASRPGSKHTHTQMLPSKLWTQATLSEPNKCLQRTALNQKQPSDI